MDIPFLISLMQSKLNYLNNARSGAVSVGDVAGITTIDQEILTTQNTLAQLNLLVQMTQAAVDQNTTTADMIAGVLQTTPTMQGPSASAVINGYDISAYATDPLYEQKIHAILAAMPVFSDASDLTSYIESIASGSPLRGDMIFAAASQFAVDIPLMTAIMQNDSQFGTQGVAVSTNNPGNVGNTGYATQTYPSWQDGVNAVADWLAQHRVAAAPIAAVIPPAPVDQTPPVTKPTVPESTSTPATTTPVTTDTSTASTTPPVVTPPDVATTTPATTTPDVSTTDTGTTTDAFASSTDATNTSISDGGNNATTTDDTATTTSP